MKILTCLSVLYRLCLHHFKYVGKRQISANSLNIGKPKTVKAMTLPARMVPPDFSSDSTTATGTLQPQNLIVKENLIENDIGKSYQALLEANMSTEVGLIALDCLGLFCIHFKVSIIICLLLFIKICTLKFKQIEIAGNAIVWGWRQSSDAKSL